MADQLEKTLNVDLSQLDAQLRQEEVLWRSIDERSNTLEKKLQRQNAAVQQLERRVVASSRLSSAAEERSIFGRVGMRFGKKISGNAIANGLSLVSGFGGPLTGRIGNVAADALFGSRHIAAGGIFGAVMWGLNETMSRIEEEKTRRENLEKLVTQYYEDLREEQIRLKYKLEDEERERQESDDLKDIKANGEAKEMIYQSLQFVYGQ